MPPCWVLLPTTARPLALTDRCAQTYYLAMVSMLVLLPPSASAIKSASSARRELLSVAAIETSAQAVARNAPDVQVKGVGLPLTCPTTVELNTGDMSEGTTPLVLGTDFTLQSCTDEGFR